MTERRPHWSDELIDEVDGLVADAALSFGSHVYQIIAAVEDSMTLPRSLVDEIELTLTASGYVRNEWSAREVATVVVAEVRDVLADIHELRDRVWLLENGLSE